MRALTTLPLAVALAIVAAAAIPMTSAQDDADDSSNDLVLADGRAEGRFVAFDVGDDAVCGWSFEGQAVIDAMVGVGGNARTQGRSVVVDGQDQARQGSTSCGASNGDDGDDDADRDGDDDADDGNDEPDQSDGGSGNSTGGGNTTRNASASATSSASASRTASGSARPAALVQAHLHDNPSGIITLDLDAGEQVRLDFHEGLDVRTDGGKVAVRGDGVRASLFTSGGGDDGVDLRVQDSSVHVTANADARVHFRMGDGDADREQQDDVEEHVDDGDVACEVFVSDDDEPHVVQIDGTNVVVSAVHTSVRVDLDIDVDVDVDLGGGSDSNATQTQSQTRTVTQTQTQTSTQTVTRTTTTGSGGGGGGSSTTRTVTGGAGCGCAQTVIILDVDVTVLVLEDHDDLLVRLNGILLAEADSVEDALTVEAGEDPEALVVVDQEQEVKVLLSLAQGQNQLSLERQDGETFETREPQRYSTRTTLGDDGFVPVNDVDVEGGDRDASGAVRGNDASDEDGGTDVSVPGLGWVAVVAAVAGAGLLMRRRLD